MKQRIDDTLAGSHRGKVSIKKQWKEISQRDELTRALRDISTWLQAIFWLAIIGVLFLLGIILRLFVS